MPKTVTDLPFEAAEKYPDRISHKFRVDKGTESRTYAQFAVSIRELAAAFRELGIARGDHVGFFVNNRYEWSVTDYALQALGAVSVPRGSDTSPREVQFLYHHSDASFLILENVGQFTDLQDSFKNEDWKSCRAIMVMDDPPIEGPSADAVPSKVDKKTVFYSHLFNRGRELLAADPELVDRLREEISLDDLLTIVYTSGTTGNPKGVMLSHANFMQNVVANTPRLQVDASRPEVTVVMLPSWHVYERAFEFVCHYTALTIVYSSAGRFASDLLEEKPQLIISVPRVWESIYQKMIRAISQMPGAKRGLIAAFIKINQVFLSSLHYLRGGYIRLEDRSGFRRTISWLRHVFLLAFMFPGHLLAGILFKPFREKVGGRMRIATSGAGSLPKYLDEVFNALGITIVNAYGMTECAPGILSRTVACNTFGSTGRPFDHTEVEIRAEDGSRAATGEKGVVFVRGPQVMKGYYKNPEATAAVLDSEGWLNTGDLAIRSENGEIIIAGRLKDTIVLMGGENVEPENIEDKMKESLYIDHAVVLGQDQKQLTAIVAVNEEELMKLAAELKVAPADINFEGEESIEQDSIYQHLMNEVKGLISKDQGFKPFEFISRILPVRNDFSIGKELTQTLKVKRQYVIDKYHGLVKKLMNDTKKK